MYECDWYMVDWDFGIEKNVLVGVYFIGHFPGGGWNIISLDRWRLNAVERVSIRDCPFRSNTTQAEALFIYLLYLFTLLYTTYMADLISGGIL